MMSNVKWDAIVAPGSKIGKAEIALLRVLTEANVPFMVHGGLAMTCYGLRPKSQPVNDVDIEISPSSESLQRFAVATRMLAKIAGKQIVTDIDLEHLAAPGSYFEIGEYFNADFGVEKTAEKFAECLARSVPMVTENCTFNLMSLSDILANMRQSLVRYDRCISRHDDNLVYIQSKLSATNGSQSYKNLSSILPQSNDIWLLSILAKHGVPFVIFGDVAFRFHGIENGQFTELHVLVYLNPSMGASKTFAEGMEVAAKAAGKVVQESFNPLRLSKPNAAYTPDSRQFNIAFRAASSRDKFDEYYSNAITARLGTVDVKVASLPAMQSIVSDFREEYVIRGIKNRTDLERIEEHLSHSEAQLA
jgi:hypothetical protein